MKRNSLRQTHTIFQWFLTIFVIISILFCLAMLPIYIYLQNTFTELQLEKNRQQLSSGAEKVNSLVDGMLNISLALANDPRFISLRYETVDYDKISVNTRNQMKNVFNNLTFPLDSAFHIALLLDQNAVITDSTTFFEDITCYYPDFFCVDDLSYSEYADRLSSHTTGFLPVSRVKNYSKEYDALIFSTKWTKSTYLYACLEIPELKSFFVAEPYLNECFITFTNLEGDLLYSDLPEAISDCHILNEIVTSGNLKISVYIPKPIFYRDMQPLYLFSVLYSAACVIMLILIILFGTRISAKPVLNIVQTLEHSRHIPFSGVAKDAAHSRKPPKPNSFEYISERILSADRHLEEYQNTVHTQQKILQARFLEKAINSPLVNIQDIQQFHTYFPDFFDRYRLVLIRLWTYAEDADNTATLYDSPLTLLQYFLDSELPNVYHQQFSETELLLLISETDFENYNETLDFLIKNINQEEPSYFACCIASETHCRPENLSAAYRQLQDMKGLSLSSDRIHVYSVSDFSTDPNIPFTMTDLQTLYTAINYGNRDMAMQILRTCSDELQLAQNTLFIRPIYEMLQTILTFIRLEHPLLLLDYYVPDCRTDISIYDQLAELIETFCNLIYDNIQNRKDPFTQELFEYIDKHFTDCNLCITSLETYFKCSESTIRKAFKSVTDISISRYIEQKRMHLANELLAQKQKTITEIALECGFSNLNSFYKAYKRIYGYAPTMQTTYAKEDDNARGHIIK